MKPAWEKDEDGGGVEQAKAGARWGGGRWRCSSVLVGAAENRIKCAGARMETKEAEWRRKWAGKPNQTRRKPAEFTRELLR